MASKSGIYQLLEDRLKATGTEPLTCVDLYDFPEIKGIVRTSNKV